MGGGWQQLRVWILCMWLMYGYYVEVASFDRGCVVFGYFCGWGVVVGFSLWLWVKRKRDCEEREREK